MTKIPRKKPGDFYCSQTKKDPILSDEVFSMAAGEGFEPSHTESESAVLPLHNPAKRKAYYTSFFKFVKRFFRLLASFFR